MKHFITSPSLEVFKPSKNLLKMPLGCFLGKNANKKLSVWQQTKKVG
jgi:hypothetical protein